MALRFVVFASGNGSNFEALIKATQNGDLDAQCVGLIVDRMDAYAIKRAHLLNIPVSLYLKDWYMNKEAMENTMLKQIQAWDAQWIVCAGYMRIIGKTLLEAFPNKIVNIHPSLLPKYRGKDALGQALQAKDKVLGITVHYVDDGLDTGKIIDQVKFEITGDEPRIEIEAKLHNLEHTFYPSVLKQLWEVKP
ncbi:MAG: phosphoribosylglycinamide formyltransferase [Bacilli bacterium]|nr:phosphoribosylglycinamide formyltransferase [Bacilli bacterium]